MAISYIAVYVTLVYFGILGYGLIKDSPFGSDAKKYANFCIGTIQIQYALCVVLNMPNIIMYFAIGLVRPWDYNTSMREKYNGWLD